MEEYSTAMTTDYVSEVIESFNNAFDSWNELLDMYRNGDITLNQIDSAYSCVQWLERILPKKINDFNLLNESRIAEDPKKAQIIKRKVSQKNRTQLKIAAQIFANLEELEDA